MNAKKNYQILDNVPELDDELAPDSVLPENLVDRLPFLKYGLWEKVHIASLVPKEKVKAPEEKNLPVGMGGMMGGMGGMRGGMGGMMGGMGGMRGGMGGMMGGMGAQQGAMMANMMKGQGSRMMGGMERGGMGGMAGMMGGMGGSTEAVGNFWKSEEKKVMIRGLDFTVEPDETYQYRVAVVVWNPNLNREDVSPGTDNKSKVLIGPWSKETEAVTMPPDVMPYAIGTLPNVNSEAQVRFQVVRFHPNDGVTVPRSFEASIGELIGERRTHPVPVSDGSGKKTVPIDFTTHQIVLDVSGGGFQQLPNGFVGPPIARPALAALLRPDGTIAVHYQSDDEVNEVRKDIQSTYDHEIASSTKERKSSQGLGYQGMMGGRGGMGGMMGGSMMGGGMMGGGRR